MEITFLLNGETMRVTAQPTVTLLDWLRKHALSPAAES